MKQSAPKINARPDVALTIEQNANRGRLPGAVEAEEAENFAALHVERDNRERRHAAVPLAQPVESNRRCGVAGSLTGFMAARIVASNQSGHNAQGRARPFDPESLSRSVCS